MNPLSPFTYYRRHKLHLIALTVLFTLTVTGTYLFIGLAEETYISPAYTINRYLDKFSIIQPDLEKNLKQDVISKIYEQPGVDKVLQQINIRIKVPNIGGAYFPFRIIGLKNADIAYVLDKCGLVLKDGKLPETYTNSVVLSEEIVKSLNLKIGDTIDQIKNEKLYRNIERPLKLTGILSGDVRLGIMSYEYLNEIDSISKFAINGCIVFALPGHEAEVRVFLQNNIKNNFTKVYTNETKSEDVARDQKFLFQIGIPIVLLITIAFMLVTGAINKLFFTRRLPEFGILYSIGRSKKWLVKQLAIESSIPAFLGWVQGILLAWIIMAVISITIYEPHGFSIQSFILTSTLFTIAIPFGSIIFTFYNAIRILKKMDAISIVERSDFNIKAENYRTPNYSINNRSFGLLSSIIYYKRHFGQAILIISIMLLMTICTALIIFIFSAGVDSLQPALTNMSKISAVTPNSKPLDKKLIEKIKSNPAVERIIPVYDFSPLKISIPPMFPDHPIETYCVSSDDMQFLVELYNLKLLEGNLPSDNTNEIVLPWAIAKNRNIKIGTVIGNPANPIYPNASSLPIEVIVSDIFAPAKISKDETWFSFMSLEYVDPYRASHLSLIIVPKVNQKEKIDDWLMSNVAGENNIVYTYNNQKSLFQKEMATMLFTFSAMEGIIVILTGLVLIGLLYSFLIQRKTEFGILNALGFIRKKLLKRIIFENIVIAGIAWIFGILLCFVILIIIKYGMYYKVGLRPNFLNPVPWLFTLPVPIIGLLVSAITTIKILTRIDPLDIIEHR